MNDLIKNTTLESQLELADTEMAFEVAPKYEIGRVGSGRRKIVGLRFELLQPRPTTIPVAWLTNETTGPLIEKLRQWKVTDHNIALYAMILQRTRIQKLIKGWETKNNSNRHIDSREKYCNAAFVRAAKQLIEQQKTEALQVRDDLQLGLFDSNTSVALAE